MKMTTRKNIHNLSKGSPNTGFMQEKVQKGDFLKKPSQELKYFCCFRFLGISRKSGPDICSLICIETPLLILLESRDKLERDERKKINKEIEAKSKEEEKKRQVCGIF